MGLKIVNRLRGHAVFPTGKSGTCLWMNSRLPGLFMTSVDVKHVRLLPSLFKAAAFAL